MQDRIFDDGLQQERQCDALAHIDPLPDHKRVIKFLPEPELLYLHVDLDVAQFLLEGRECRAAVFQHIPHGFSQQPDRRRRLPVAGSVRLHPYRLERVVQKMRIDLACQHLELHLLLLVDKLLLVQHRPVHQRILLLDPLYHDLKIREHLGELVIAAHDLLKIVVLIARLVHHMP